MKFKCPICGNEQRVKRGAARNGGIKCDCGSFMQHKRAKLKNTNKRKRELEALILEQEKELKRQKYGYID